MSLIIDVSANNGMIDWHKVTSNNPKIDGVIIKVNEGYLCADVKAKYNSTQCGLLNIPVGYYHFATLNNNDVVSDATQEANYFLASLNDLTKESLPLVLDIETNKNNLTADKVVLWAKTFIGVLKEAGKTNIALYSGLSFFNSEHFVKEEFFGILIWLAEYNKGVKPVLPKGFDDYWLWQYSCEGKIDGIIGSVDLNKLKI